MARKTKAQKNDEAQDASVEDVTGEFSIDELRGRLYRGESLPSGYTFDPKKSPDILRTEDADRVDDADLARPDPADAPGGTPTPPETTGTE